MSNPRRKRRNFRRRRSNRKRSNPFVRRSRRSGFLMRSGGRRRRRNPSIAGFSATDIAYLGAGAIVGGLGVRKLVQSLLQSNNSGAVGYAANLAAAVALGWAGNKYVGKGFGDGVLAGGVSATIMRIWSDRVSQTTAPAAMSGLGDLDFSDDGLGAYVASGFPSPTHSSIGPSGYLTAESMQSANPAAAGAGSGTALQPALPARLSPARLGF